MALRMKDIAAELGISVSTVSRALKNDPHISIETRTRVFEFVREKNYVKNRSLKKKIYYIIDKKYFLFTSNFYNPLIQVIEEEVIKKGFEFHFTTIADAKNLFSKVDLKDIAGILMTSSYIETLIPIFNENNIPIVLVDSYLPLENTNAVLPDNSNGIMNAVKFLVEHGHKQIGYLEGDLQDIDCADRLTGFKRGLELFEVPLCEETVLSCNLNMLSSYQAMMKFLKEHSEVPSAFIGANDVVTIGAMRAAKDFGLDIPEDISFIGFDDVDLSKDMVPSLTTVHVDRESLGLVAVQRLVQLINNEPIHYHKMLICTTIVERDSVANRSLLDTSDKEVSGH
ncbi:MAG: LacI family DNA-binding transcriptional regulator [Sphaerochaetaceae bacterium]|jgi:DNA-binding LacI/PurR family transcriptional regulator